jgi:hypothetical protein
VLADVGGASREGFHAERIALGIERLQWPAADAVVNTVVMTRPAFALPSATPWPRLRVTGGLSIVDGSLRQKVPGGRALHDLEVSLAPSGVVGGARLRLSASTEAGGRLGLDRIVTSDGPGPHDGLPLGVLLVALEDAALVSPDAVTAPGALPAGTILSP